MTTNLSLSSRCQAKPKPLSPCAPAPQLRAFTHKPLQGTLMMPQKEHQCPFQGAVTPCFLNCQPWGCQSSTQLRHMAPRQLCLSSESKSLTHTIPLPA